MVVVVGLQDVHLQWYGLEHGSGPTTPYGPPCFGGGGGRENGHRCPSSEHPWFSTTGRLRGRALLCLMHMLWRSARRPSICVV